VGEGVKKEDERELAEILDENYKDYLYLRKLRGLSNPV
jgi:hypothetical protein